MNDWIIRMGKRRLLPWKRIGWADAMIYSRTVYAGARDKLDDALRRPNARGEP